MKIIRPHPITESDVTSDVAITETEWTAGTYNAGDQRYYGIILYEALSTTTDQPDVGAAKAVPTWLDIGYINRFKMFDNKTGSPTTDTTEMIVSVELTGLIVNSIGCFNLIGETLQIDVVDTVGSDGTVYTSTIGLVDEYGITNWYEFFFEPYTLKQDVVFLDLPAYPSAEITFTLSGTGAIEFGEAVLGIIADLGVTVNGTGISIVDYSTKDTDSFGNFIITERPFSKKADYDVVMEIGDVAKAQSVLAGIRATPAVYIGAVERQTTIIYGYYRDFNIVFSNGALAEASISVEGL